MRINQFVLIWIAVFAFLAAMLSAGFYIIERNLLLSTIADSYNQTGYQLENEIRQLLETGHEADIQKILDQTPAINKSIAEVSVSKTGKQIDYSSSRSQQGKLVADDYHTTSSINKQLLKEHTQFKSHFEFYEGAHQHNAALLIRVDEGYVFGRLKQTATYFTLVIFVVIGIGSVVAFFIMRRLLSAPLEKLIQNAKTAKSNDEPHFIAELTELENSLRTSFEHLRRQQNDLQHALDESLYLDRILRTVADINQLLIASDNIKNLLNNSADRLAQHAGYSLCWIATEANDNLLIQAFSDTKSDLTLGTKIACINDTSDNPINHAFLQHKPIVISHLDQHQPTQAWQTMTEYGQYGSFIALPLIPSIYEKPIGVIGIYSENSHGFITKEIEMLQELSGDIGFAIKAFSQRAELEYHLTTDATTNLPNRTSLIDALATKPNATVAIINLDRFSEINDVYGSKVGDQLLVQYGQWLLQKIEMHNAVSLYKMAGDEYVLVFNDQQGIAAYCDQLESLIESTAKTSFTINDIEIFVSITIGIAEASERVLAHASSAIKQAKAARKRLQVYTKSLTNKSHDTNISWYKRIKLAIEESRIVPFFQPIVSNQTRQIIKYEALIRMVEKDGSIVSPIAFLDMAKKMRMYTQLTSIMIEKTLETFKHSKIPVSINLSTEDLLNTELADVIEKSILANHMGQLVIFEILESEGIENYTEVSAFVDRFKSLGCHFAIDDFGSGYSNFDHLLKLNIDTIKIDASLIKNLPHDRNARIFVQHICDFAHEMGITTVAEFVASEAIFLQVKEIGINASQGYYFYEPSALLVNQQSPDKDSLTQVL
jgi:diguanylate cyclase (GGDEF)-like protein